MLQIFTTPDNRKFELLWSIKIPERVAEAKLDAALSGMLYLKQRQPNGLYIYIVNEIIDAKFQDITDSNPPAVAEEIKLNVPNAINEMTGSETPKIA